MTQLPHGRNKTFLPRIFFFLLNLSVPFDYFAEIIRRRIFTLCVIIALCLYTGPIILDSKIYHRFENSPCCISCARSNKYRLGLEFIGLCASICHHGSHILFQISHFQISVFSPLLFHSLKFAFFLRIQSRTQKKSQKKIS